MTRRFAELQESCTGELLMFDRPPPCCPSGNPEQTAILQRGKRWRIVYAPESLQSAETRDHVEELIAEGEEARVLPGPPMKLVIVNQRIALLPLTLDSGLAQVP